MLRFCCCCFASLFHARRMIDGLQCSDSHSLVVFIFVAIAGQLSHLVGLDLRGPNKE